jgi:predicted site-specific integrase-resolvase
MQHTADHKNVRRIIPIAVSAAAAGVSTRTLRRMAARGLIKITKLTERKHGLSEEEHAKLIEGRAA